MFTDEHRCNAWNQMRQQDTKAFEEVLTPEILQQAAEAAKVKIGKNPLNWANMVWLGILSALHTGKNFLEVLGLVRKIAMDFEDANLRHGSDKPEKTSKKGKKSKHNPYGDGETVSEEAFVQARRRMPWAFWVWLLVFLGERFQKQYAGYVQWNGFRLLAMDGTEIALQRYPKLIEHFGTSSNGKSRRSPQARMVMLAFPLARMPWRFELEPCTVHEQKLGAKLLAHLQPADLVLIDRGFWSAALFALIQEKQAFFGIRLRAGVKLKTLRRLGHDDHLVEWRPSASACRQRDWVGVREMPEALKLRVIRYHFPGFRPSAIVTNVLDPARISAAAWVGLATSEAGTTLQSGLYHRRWEIETMFSELKVWQGMAHIRSRTPESVKFEVAGHVLLYTLMRWLSTRAAVEHKSDPLRLSYKSGLNEVRDMQTALFVAAPQRAARVLLPRLRERLAQHYVPSRPGRHYDRPADKYALKKYRQAAKLVTKKA